MPKSSDLAHCLGRVGILQTPQCCSFVLILMCFAARNRSCTVMLNISRPSSLFIWNWSLNDFFDLPGLLAIPFKYLNENEEGLCCVCHSFRFQWTTQHQNLKGQGDDFHTGPLAFRRQLSLQKAGCREALAMYWLGEYQESQSATKSFYPLA